METTIKLNTHELREVLKNGALLVLAETVNNLDFASKQEVQAISQTMPAPVVNTPVAVEPMVVPVEQSAFIPVTAAPPTVTAVPVTVQSYTADQLAVAATQLSDAGRREELVQLLSVFGVQALTLLPKEQYGAFATKLREMGAKI